ncbi:condensation domain-containing protein [Brevibacillus porteri]|uniref:Polyketide synthase n=1 Tax=Brevibacillus porteri TaxID=2126350 RepID=A0ABX5FW64_9BACL|nr:condensation domain-containing protein [Brevibacillus porteri]MED1798840.1 condensation domain-containing protein [Brevibacillus porteri]MED2131523.1 condensation domain-containing protein [Brevibacillus porteri]MED2744076.1 condensation domain-containing protein [Brevibacillus porteri]MED2813290.1 condensation domain-containing protein [Brevibacillus porteri]MED2896608.1 condensation domain-containing protein [Brevibacillus porteri]
MSKEIAVIGMSGMFPLADNLEELAPLLMSGADTVREAPLHRVKLAGLPLDRRYVPMAYVEHMEHFDYPFFRISQKEAKSMDPQQRVALQLACAAIEHAGYSLSSFRGTRTAVMMSAAGNQYGRLLREKSGVAFVGNHTAAIAGKISYYLDLRGTAMMIDTTCSSSLAAVHFACQSLRNKEADTALAGGVNLLPILDEIEALENEPLGIAAPDGRSKSFDERANGTGAGEGAGIVLLKRLEDAIRDGDYVHAVISGSAMNQDAARSNSLGAPSPVAQTEVIREAWEQAGIHPRQISYIEAHGTGTRLGDPIEIKGLTDAFRLYTTDTSFCAIGSVKSNIGHLGNSAGITGLIKVILSMRDDTLYPLVHFQKPNPLINFAESAVYPIDRAKPWQAEPKIAGISSFGLSGTNVHAVVREAGSGQLTKKGSVGKPQEEGHQLITLSAMTERSLTAFARHLGAYVQKNPFSLSQISYVLNAGRDDYPVRAAMVVNNLEQLKRYLDGLEQREGICETLPRAMVLLCSGDAPIEENLITRWMEEEPVWKHWWERCSRESDITHPHVRRTAMQICHYQVLSAKGFKALHVLGTGTGNFAVRFVTGQMTLAEGLAAANQYQEDAFDHTRLKVWASQFCTKHDALFFELASNGVLSRTLLAIDDLDNKPVFVHMPKESLLHSFQVLYQAGIKVDWQAYYKDSHSQRIPLPTYSFEPLVCWPEQNERVSIDVVPQQSISHEEHGVADKAVDETIEQAVHRIWREVLEHENFGEEDDFFELGGNSLMGTQMMGRMKTKFGVELDFEQLYEYSTVRTLSDYLRSLLSQQEPASKPAANELIRINRTGSLPLSHAQERMLMMHLQEPDSAYYHMPAHLKLTGVLDERALERSIQMLIERHEILRTVYASDNGDHRQRIVEANLSVLREDWTTLPRVDIDQRLKEQQYAIFQKPFDLSKDIPIRIALFKTGQEEFHLFLNIHHIAADGWSVDNFIREWSECYTAFIEGKSPRLRTLAYNYCDYAVWQKEWLLQGEGERQLTYWTQKLSGITGHLPLVTDKLRPPIPGFAGKVHTFAISETTTKALQVFCQEEKATFYMALFAIYSILLSRYSGESDVCIGSPVANRTRAELEPIIGYFSNTVVLRSKVTSGLPFRSYVQEVKRTVLEAFQHQDYPFDLLVKNLSVPRHRGCHPLFQHAFVLQNATSAKWQWPRVQVEWMEAKSLGAKFDFTLSLAEEDGRLKGFVEYSTDLFEEQTIAQMIRHYIRLLESAVASPGTSVEKLAMLSTEEEAGLVSTTSQSRGAEDYDFS